MSENKQLDRNASWAKPVSRLSTADLPRGAVNLNVAGRQVVGPLQGFGQLWQKTYRVRLSGSEVTPTQVIQVWKENFPRFWPPGNKFFGPLTGIKPGEVAVLNLAGPGGLSAPGGMPVISTGVLVIYADDESFSFMTPQGHMFAAIITFSAFDDDGTVVQVQALVRANDPLYELSFRLGVGHKAEDEFWQQTLENLAAHFGVRGQVQQKVTLVDARVQWSQARNIWHNAAIRTAFYTPVALVRRLIKR
ncbi:MAG: hypothetical protein JSV61_02720 [Anaerolineales bacterium]|nr:MAG: hypothetical protein JSV61_02720 [Anaerolineales bacterium]